MKLNSTLKRRKESKNGERRYTLRDMAVIKHDQAVRNAQVKRGEKTNVEGGIEYIAVCGCGVEGCFLHLSYKRD